MRLKRPDGAILNIYNAWGTNWFPNCNFTRHYIQNNCTLQSVAMKHNISTIKYFLIRAIIRATCFHFRLGLVDPRSFLPIAHCFIWNDRFNPNLLSMNYRSQWIYMHIIYTWTYKLINYLKACRFVSRLNICLVHFIAQT